MAKKKPPAGVPAIWAQVKDEIAAALLSDELRADVRGRLPPVASVPPSPFALIALDAKYSQRARSIDASLSDNFRALEERLNTMVFSDDEVPSARAIAAARLIVGRAFDAGYITDPLHQFDRFKALLNRYYQSRS